MLRGCWSRWARGGLHVLPASFGSWSQCQSRFRSDLFAGAVQVSSLGRVKSLKGVITHGSLSSYGYRRSNIQGKQYYVHRLVARAFHGPPPSAEHTQVNHLDGDRANNWVNNLQYATPSENSAHAHATFTWEKSGQAVYCRPVGSLNWTSFPSQSEAARALQVTRSSVGRCCSGMQQQSGGYEFKSVEPVSLPGEVWQAARYPGIAHAISQWQVSNLGRVKTDIGRITRGSLMKSGYFIMRHYSKSTGLYQGFLVHRLVAATFVGQPSMPDLQVNHLDSDPSNNDRDNLEYVTPLQNRQHAIMSLAGRSSTRPNLRKPVLAREFLKESPWIHFESVSAAATRTGIQGYRISKMCRGDICHKSWQFKYASLAKLPGEEWRDVILDWSYANGELGY
ncbi:unnamed protein product [Effrenium voratum]|nr:unnamed protein product [Effrenium voratum]